MVALTALEPEAVINLKLGADAMSAEPSDVTTCASGFAVPVIVTVIASPAVVRPYSSANLPSKTQSPVPRVPEALPPIEMVPRLLALKSTTRVPAVARTVCPH